MRSEKTATILNRLVLKVLKEEHVSHRLLIIAIVVFNIKLKKLKNSGRLRNSPSTSSVNGVASGGRLGTEHTARAGVK
jgi:hypothetical protein